ncbi:unnamed protein product [Mucor hiemalis]
MPSSSFLKFVPYKLAPTGIAATTIEGQTIHRFLGITSCPDKSSPSRVDGYFQKIGDNRSMALLIDELSMFPSSILDTLHETMVKTTGTQEPIGGVLTIFFGDFAQFTPVVRRAIQDTLIRCDAHPIFDHDNMYNLTTLVRASSEDPVFRRLLTMARINRFDEDLHDIIQARTILPPDDVLQPPGYVSSLKLLTTPLTSSAHVCYLAETGLPKTIILKQGVPVMVIDNLDVANGWEQIDSTNKDTPSNLTDLRLMQYDRLVALASTFNQPLTEEVDAYNQKKIHMTLLKLLQDDTELFKSFEEFLKKKQVDDWKVLKIFQYTLKKDYLDEHTETVKAFKRSVNRFLSFRTYQDKRLKYAIEKMKINLDSVLSSRLAEMTFEKRKTFF